MHRTARAQSLELGGRDVAERLVQAVVVKPGDPLDDRELELGSGAPHAVGDQLGLEGVDEALGERVVVGVADRADRAQDVMVVEDLLKGEAGVLRAGIGVVDEVDVGAGLATRERHPQGIEDEIGAHVRRELPADDPSAEHVDDEAEEHHPLVAAHVGEVRHPQRVGPIGREGSDGAPGDCQLAAAKSR